MNTHSLREACLVKQLHSKIERLEQENQKLRQENDRLKQSTLIDFLTGLPNRRYLEKVLQQEYNNALRYNYPLGILALDLDRFKLYNDTYGHLAGDRLLLEVAILLKQVLQRPKDMLFRYGGEEFTCILPDTPVAGVEKVAQKLLQNVRLSGVTVSIGAICVTVSRQEHPYQLLEIADKAMYQAKLAGRDRLVLVDRYTRPTRN